MKRDQLNEVLELSKKLRAVEFYLPYSGRNTRIFQKKKFTFRIPSGNGFEYLDIDGNYLLPALVAYRNELKAKLKELCYED
jgi:hypothetical protein